VDADRDLGPSDFTGVAAAASEWDRLAERRRPTMADPWVAITGVLVAAGLMAAYAGLVLWARRSGSGLILWARNNFKHVAVLGVMGVLLVVLQCNPPYVVEEERAVQVASPPGSAEGKDTTTVSVRKRVGWDRESRSVREPDPWDRGSRPEPPRPDAKSWGVSHVDLENGVTLSWHIDSARLIAESALVLAGGAVLCSLLRARGSPRASDAEPDSAAGPPRE
jgi:hypothetical protein